MTLSTKFRYALEAVKKNAGETDVDAIKRIVVERAKNGWRVVEASGDENLQPALIFEEDVTGECRQYEYEVLEVPNVEGQDQISELREKLMELNNEGWLVLTVLDSIITRPIAILRKTDRKPADAALNLKMVSCGTFESVPNAIMKEVTNQQTKNNWMLKAIVNGGLHPVLIFGETESAELDEFMVEYADGGLFSNRQKELGRLIEERAAEGWRVSGAFEDSFRMPCVVFHRVHPNTPA